MPPQSNNTWSLHFGFSVLLAYSCFKDEHTRSDLLLLSQAHFDLHLSLYIVHHLGRCPAHNRDCLRIENRNYMRLCWPGPFILRGPRFLVARVVAIMLSGELEKSEEDANPVPKAVMSARENGVVVEIEELRGRASWNPSSVFSKRPGAMRSRSHSSSWSFINRTPRHFIEPKSCKAFSLSEMTLWRLTLFFL